MHWRGLKVVVLRFWISRIFAKLFLGPTGLSARVTNHAIKVIPIELSVCDISAPERSDISSGKKDLTPELQDSHKHPVVQTLFDIAGVKVASSDFDSMVNYIVGHVVGNRPLHVAFANTNLLNQARHDPILRIALSNFLVLNDGIGVEIAAKCLEGRGFLANLNGTDLTEAVIQNIPKDSRVYLFGGKQHVVLETANALQYRHHIKVCGWKNGYDSDSETVINDIRRTGAQLVLVALGNPKQELWIHDFFGTANSPVMMAVGAYMDFASGHIARAPSWIRRLRLEWAYRLKGEPRRLWRRYTVEMGQFFWFVLLQAIKKRIFGSCVN